MIGAAAVLKEQDFILSSLAPSPGQKRLALAVVVFLLAAFFTIVGPLAAVHLPKVGAFIAIYATAMFVTDMITAVLLFAQFSILRSRALLAISSGYLFAALMVIPWMLTFPSVIAPTGLLGAGLQSTVWLYMIWHAGFPIMVIAYALLKDVDPTQRLWAGSVRTAILWTVGLTAGVVCAATYLVTADPQLPPLMLDPVQLSPLWAYAAAGPILLSVTAGVLLWTRRRSVLDLWLMVVMCAYVIEIGLIRFPIPARYSIGWYSGRVIGVLSASLVLFVLLYEITTLYAGLLRAVSAQRREREARLMTGDAVSASIAHEIRQPLAAMTTSAAAGRRWLNRETPDLPEAMAAFEAISTAGERAGALIEGIRAMFRKDAMTRTSVDMNELVSEALGQLSDELREHRISVRTELPTRAPRVTGDRVQLQQVLVNLIANAIDAMANTEGPRELRVKSAAHEAGGAVISVSDTGPGVEATHRDQIFNPLFTTKAHGMGMGLSICRSIVEAHDGQLWVTPNRPHGAVFQLLVPADPADSAGREKPSKGDVRASGGDPAVARLQ
ncbi:two-component sensor histidine kinase [Phenylobacterium hankyongense]|uniref:histidine kinase n=2 Tax=Phenylobacterium hankyongense TaxID=1813876 RepID=A0A328B040_9CAUL|nr:two-component sensor histidine kinase [Phenylobacterium hankyongense]